MFKIFCGRSAPKPPQTEQAPSSSPVKIEFPQPPPLLHTYTHTTKNAQLSLAGQFSRNHETLLPLKKFILVTQHNVC